MFPVHTYFIFVDWMKLIVISEFQNGFYTSLCLGWVGGNAVCTQSGAAAWCCSSIVIVPPVHRHLPHNHWVAMLEYFLFIWPWSFCISYLAFSGWSTFIMGSWWHTVLHPSRHPSAIAGMAAFPAQNWSFVYSVVTQHMFQCKMMSFYLSSLKLLRGRQLFCLFW